MKLLFVTIISLLPVFANAAESGLSCSMAYSSTDALSNSTDSDTRWLVAGETMPGSAVGVGKDGLWSQSPATTSP